MRIFTIIAIIIASFTITIFANKSLNLPEEVTAEVIDSEILESMTIAMPEPSLVDKIADYASKFIGTRYRYGSTGPKTFDCSGFMGHIFRQEGIELPRTSRMQYQLGEKVNRDEIRPGDLLFFSSPRSGKGRVGHVAMVVDVDQESGNCTFIHASSSKGVSYQTFPDGGYYSRNYIGAKRIIDADASART